ncbi:Chitin synthase, class 6 [Entomophthora muscae]|uniref:Chitin synthase, class 6 n=1 Tax=Entomophthora muscae TaxID=34485 RepID=A0ACC2SS23_9FUNG|nr:Chitin synthase, class 6 [Entomophthora muscae]
MGKVYTGLYECKGHVVPYIVVVKVGRAVERAKPGNRGKRDSQMILMRFFNKVHYNYPMVPLELEMYHQIKNVIGVDPHYYEFVLMVDADTLVLPDSLNRLVSAMLHDTKIMGICGETALLNEKATWATMIQVYEYYLSHYLAKSFESLFGSVTCLPGCFSMYRLRSADGSKPLLVNNQIIQDYSENVVETLHMKNLLHLGEDRYLTTLMLKHFPFFKMTFTPDAKCLTNAPDTFSVLLSQRRRWINSTVHNLMELVFLPRLCGFCCFSMRFVVFMDLFSTIVMPAMLGYLAYILYRLAVDTDKLVSTLSIVFLVAPYALQMLVFLIRRQWQHIGWMFIYLMALPMFAFFIPIYSFWHFDDFSWGNTRVVVGEGGKKKVLAADNGKFDPSTIPTRRWDEYQADFLDDARSEISSSRPPSARSHSPRAPQPKLPDILPAPAPHDGHQ